LSADEMLGDDDHHLQNQARKLLPQLAPRGEELAAVDIRSAGIPGCPPRWPKPKDAKDR
jgi:hypothetical protein